MTIVSAGEIRDEYLPNGGVQWHLKSKVALDLLYWVMHLAPYHLICMAIEMASKVGAVFSIIDFMSCINVAKQPC